MNIGTSNGETLVTTLSNYINPLSAPANTPTTYAVSGGSTSTTFQANTAISFSGSVILNNTVVQNIAIATYAAKQSGTATALYIVGSSTNPSSQAIITRIA